MTKFIALLLSVCLTAAAACTRSSSTNVLDKKQQTRVAAATTTNSVSTLAASAAASAPTKAWSVVRTVKHLGHMFATSFMHGHIKAVIIAMAGISVLLELFDEVVRDVPYLQKFVGKAGVHHGVLLLTMSHLFSTLGSMVDRIETQANLKAEFERRALAKAQGQKVYANDEEAAKAYDLAAMSLFGHGAATNFPRSAFGPYMHLDASGQEPSRQSKYRGVVWNNDLKGWQVSEAALGLHEDDDEDERSAQRKAGSRQLQVVPSKNE